MERLRLSNSVSGKRKEIFSAEKGRIIREVN